MNLLSDGRSSQFKYSSFNFKVRIGIHLPYGPVRTEGCTDQDTMVHSMIFEFPDQGGDFTVLTQPGPKFKNPSDRVLVRKYLLAGYMQVPSTNQKTAIECISSSSFENDSFIRGGGDFMT